MTTADPFATAPADEPQTAPETAPQDGPPAGSISVAVKPVVQPLESEGKIVLTFKEAPGYDASWVVVHATTVDEAAKLLDEKFAALLTHTKKVAAFFRGGPVTASGGGSNAPQGATEAPSWAPAKPHDDFVYKTGVSKKNGRTWHAWMPPTKEDSRGAVFFDPPR